MQSSSLQPRRTRSTRSSGDPSPKSRTISPTVSRDQLDHEADLSQREEALLVELRHFYEQVDEYKAAAEQFEASKREIAARALDLSAMADELNSYHDSLKSRQAAARDMPAPPLPDYTRERLDVELLEQELRAFAEQMPARPPPGVSALRRDAVDSRRRSNAAKELDLAAREGRIEEAKRQLWERERSVKIAESADEGADREFRARIDALLKSAPRVDLAGLRRKRQRKQELDERRSRVNGRCGKLHNQAAEFASEKERREEELSGLRQKLAEAKETHETNRRLEAELDAAVATNKELTHADMSGNVLRLQRRVQIQKLELDRLEKKRKEIEEKRNGVAEKRIVEAQQRKEIAKRQQELEETEVQLQQEEGEVGEMEAEAIGLEQEWKMIQQQLLELKEKIGRARDDQAARALEKVPGAEAEGLAELQKLFVNPDGIT
jgi:chromosome segregation ATPase